jgi:hypothetical protein
MRRHGWDLVSLVPGLVFLAVGLASLAGWLDVTQIDYGWLWPIVAMVLGIVLLASLRGQSSGSKSSDSEFMQ